MDSDKELKTIGSIAMWSASRTSRTEIVDALEPLGSHACVPEIDLQKNFEYALGKACKRMSVSGFIFESKRKWRGWHAPDPMSWDIIRYQKGYAPQDTNYDVVAIAACHEKLGIERYRVYANMANMEQNFPVTTYDWDQEHWQPSNSADCPMSFATFLEEAWKEHRSELSGGEVSKTFKNILDKIGAEPLKKGNSVYWLPPELTKQWLDVRAVMEDIIPIQSFTQAATAESLASLLGIVSEDLNERCSELEEMVRENSTHKNSLDKRARLAREARAKIQKFDSILGAGLDTLRQRLHSATATTVQAEASAVSVIDDEEVFADLPF
mgnify:CR=1 FL=1